MDAVIRQPRGSAVMITIELTEDEALSLRNLLDVAVRHEGMRAAIFAVSKAIQKTLYSVVFKN
jgi:hypothetical protein